MRLSQQVAGIVAMGVLVAPAWAQSPAPRRQTRPTPTQVIVRDVSGAPIGGVKVVISRAADGEFTTDAQGIAQIVLADGSYRLRFEHDRFITLERDVTIRNSRPAEILVALNRAPPPPAPVQVPRSQPEVPVATAGKTEPPVNVSIPMFVDKNFVGRDPVKESVLACMPDATTRLLQLREPMGEHTHSDLDEVLYVVAGEGAVRIADNLVAVTPGWLSTIPRGTRHAIERRGRNPLILVSMLAGGPCPAASAPPAGSK